MSVDLESVDWRLVGAARNPLSRKFKAPNKIDYLIKASRFEQVGKPDSAKIARRAAELVNQLTGGKRHDKDNRGTRTGSPTARIP
jgi:hypothetical protein